MKKSKSNVLGISTLAELTQSRPLKPLDSTPGEVAHLKVNMLESKVQASAHENAAKKEKIHHERELERLKNNPLSSFLSKNPKS